MGWSDISAIEPQTKRAHIKILKKDPVFEGKKFISNFLKLAKEKQKNV